jgi:hypothetical protein
VVSEKHWFGLEKGVVTGFCEKCNDSSGTREMSSLAEQLLSFEEALLSMKISGWLVNYDVYWKVHLSECSNIDAYEIT